MRPLSQRPSLSDCGEVCQFEYKVRIRICTILVQQRLLKKKTIMKEKMLVSVEVKDDLLDKQKCRKSFEADAVTGLQLMRRLSEQTLYMGISSA